MEFSRHVISRNLSDAKTKCREKNMSRKLSDSHIMSIIKTLTAILSPLHTFINVSTHGSTSFVQSSNSPFTGSLKCCSASCLNLSIASTIKFSNMLNNTDKEIKRCLTQKREIKVSQNAKFSQDREINVSRQISCNKVFPRDTNMAVKT